VATPDFDFEEAEKYILQQDPALVIFLDMPVYNRPEMIGKLSSQGRVFIYDYHSPGICEVCKDKANVLYINPMILKKEKAPPTVLFAYDLLKEKTTFEKEVLFMGLFTETWLEQVPPFTEFSPTHQDQLREVAKRVHASFLIRGMGTTHYAMNFLSEIGKVGAIRLEEILTSNEYRILENIYNLVQNEKEWLLMKLKAEVKSLINPRFILKRIESKMRLCGLVASELRWTYPPYVIGIWQRWQKRYYCELRRGKSCQIDLTSLVARIRSEVNLLTGGGHPEAAAFTAEGDHFFEALDRVRYRLTASGTNCLS
jgi:single-stranded DNA-specific DHH superfamily exonuclease